MTFKGCRYDTKQMQKYVFCFRKDWFSSVVKLLIKILYVFSLDGYLEVLDFVSYLLKDTYKWCNTGLSRGAVHFRLICFLQTHLVCLMSLKVLFSLKQLYWNEHLSFYSLVLWRKANMCPKYPNYVILLSFFWKHCRVSTP